MKALEKKVAALLLSRGVLDEDSLQTVLPRYDGSRPLYELLLESGLVARREIIRARAEAEGMTFAPLDEIVPGQDALDLLAPETAWKLGVVPLELTDNGVLRIASPPDADIYLADELRHRTGRPVELLVSDREELQHAIERYYGPHPDVRRSSSGANRVSGVSEPTGSHAEYQRRVREAMRSSGENRISAFETKVFEESQDEVLTEIEHDRAARGSYDEPNQSTVLIQVSALDPESPSSLLATALETFALEGAEEMEVLATTHGGTIRIRLEEGWREIARHSRPTQKAIIALLRASAGLADIEDIASLDHQFLLPTAKGRFLAILHLERIAGGERALLRIPENRPLLEHPLRMVGIAEEVATMIEKRLLGNSGGLLLVTSPRERDVAWILAGLLVWLGRGGKRDMLALERPSERRLPGVMSINCPTEAVLLASLANASYMKPDLLAVSEVENGTVLNRLINVAQRGTIVLAGMTAPCHAVAHGCLQAAKVDPMNMMRALAGHLHLVSIQGLNSDTREPLAPDAPLPEWATEEQRALLRQPMALAVQRGVAHKGVHWLASFHAPDLEQADGSLLRAASGAAAARSLALLGLIDPTDIPPGLA